MTYRSLQRCLANAIIEGAEQPGPIKAQGADPALVEEAAEAAAPVALNTSEKAHQRLSQL